LLREPENFKLEKLECEVFLKQASMRLRVAIGQLHPAASVLEYEPVVPRIAKRPLIRCQFAAHKRHLNTGREARFSCVFEEKCHPDRNYVFTG